MVKSLKAVCREGSHSGLRQLLELSSKWGQEQGCLEGAGWHAESISMDFRHWVGRQLEDGFDCKDIFYAYDFTCPACLCTYTHAYSQFLLLQAVNILSKASLAWRRAGMNPLRMRVPYATAGATLVEVQSLLLQGDSFTPRFLVLNICFQAPCFVQRAFLCQTGWVKKRVSKWVCFMENFPLLFLIKRMAECTSIWPSLASLNHVPVPSVSHSVIFWTDSGFIFEVIYQACSSKGQSDMFLIQCPESCHIDLNISFDKQIQIHRHISMAKQVTTH